MTTIYVDHKGDAFRAAVQALLDAGREAGYTWVKAEYEHPNGGLRGTSSWGAPRAPAMPCIGCPDPETCYRGPGCAKTPSPKGGS